MTEKTGYKETKMSYLTEGKVKTNIKEGTSNKGGVNHKIVLPRPTPPKGKILKEHQQTQKDTNKPATSDIILLIVSSIAVLLFVLCITGALVIC
jgi:hypothetical protein